MGIERQSLAALGRALYATENQYGPQWAAGLSEFEKRRWCERAEIVAEELDKLGYEIKFIPPEC